MVVMVVRYLLIFLSVVISFSSYANNTVQSNVTCSSNEVVTGYNSDGSPICSKSFFVVGGSGGSGAFTYNGETTCTGDVCRGGTCSGTAPNGVCTLNVNSILGRYGSDNASSYGDPSPTDKFAAVYEYSSFTLQGGTVTIGGEGDFGGGLIIYVSGDVNITGGKIDLKGKGQKFSQAPGILGCGAGKVGGIQRLPGGKAGASGAVNNGGNGYDVISLNGLDAYYISRDTCLHRGSSGASGPFNGVQIVSDHIVSYGATGGGGASCFEALNSCSGSIAPPGEGGGYLKMEISGTYNCSNATIDLSGTDAGSGVASGGGGGGLGIIAAKDIGTNTCTYVASGGLGASGNATCGAGGNGGDGAIIVVDIP